jgi:ADP-ribose pyrophosphatase YjhB (NUDIX family)
VTGRVRKVAAVVVRASAGGDEVLVFEHPQPEGGVLAQLPAGTVEPGEAPLAAVVRELREETGVLGEVVRLAGVVDEEFEGAAAVGLSAACHRRGCAGVAVYLRLRRTGTLPLAARGGVDPPGAAGVA